nr:L-threonylcarbamoyladenylate synthase [Dictyobacter vulcani]
MQQRETQIITLDKDHLEQPHEQETLAYAARLLRAGELVVFPTETVYGLGANALNPQAAEQIFLAKERPFSDPLIVHIADEQDLANLVAHVPETARKLAVAFWPGPLTMILPAGPQVPGLITSGLPNVAVRMPNHPIARALIRTAGVPVAAPSANRFMHVSPTTAQHVYDDLKGRIPLILDGGPCTVGVESTIIDLCAAIPTILRPGGISLEALRQVLPQVQPPQTHHKHSEDLDTARIAPDKCSFTIPLKCRLIYLRARLKQCARRYWASFNKGCSRESRSVSSWQMKISVRSMRAGRWYIALATHPNR